MRLKSHELNGAVGQPLPPALLLYGDEPLLIEESRSTVLRAATAQGYEERTAFTVEPGFDWGRLTSSANALSLFAARRLLDLRMPTGRPGEAGARALVECCERGGADTALLISCGRLDARARQARWVKAVDAVGVVVEHYPVSPQELPRWIQQRLARHGLRADTEAVKWLAYYLEGNLLAAAQEIEKLSLLYPGASIDAQMVREVMSDLARFNVYAVADACLAGAAAKAVRMLDGLRREGVEPVLILWALGREVRALARIAAGLRGRQSKAALYKACNIWSRRAPLMDAALERLSSEQASDAVKRVAWLDRVLKGRENGDIWLGLETLCLTLCGVAGVSRQEGSSPSP